MNIFKTMFKTEIKLLIRDMNVLFFGVGFSVVLTVIFGLVMGNKPAYDGADYSLFETSFGAVVAIGIAATGLMGIPLVVSDYRHKKILRRFWVTPVSPTLLLFVQFAVHFVMAIVSLIAVYGLSRLFFGFKLAGSPVSFLLAYLLVLLSIYSVGMLLASISSNMKMANLLCSLFYFPMLLLSGATLPYEVMPPVMQRASDILPLTQGIKLLKATVLGLPLENMLLPMIVMIGLTVVCIGLSLRYFRWE